MPTASLNAPASPVEPNLPAPFAPVSLVTAGSFGELDTRFGVLEKKRALKNERTCASAESRKAAGPERNRLYRVVQDCLAEEERLEDLLQTKFVPQHSPKTLISPRAFFTSPLFRVASKRVARQEKLRLELLAPDGSVLLRYVGPELRQSDGLVFMSLVNLARDVQAGQPVSFSPEAACRAVFGRYDGPARKSLMEHIERLQTALIKFDSFSVQLCQRFEYPSKGAWTVALDKDIVALFSQSREVWVDFTVRTRLPDGLASWLYAFVEAQSRLIPMSLETLRKLCGSDASAKSFAGSLRESLEHLVSEGVLDEGWSINKGQLHWRKRAKPLESASSTGQAEPLALPSPAVELATGT